ncbi:MAG: Ig-like domain-containing protein, partial [Firmicutes bacterium]|nr:Ig-like domain-containing protein [Bacillota bacterium]
TVNRENVTWKSSNEEIATVDRNGVVKGIKVGECVVSAEDEEGNVSECAINVKKVCYLTFDDGPNAITPNIVDTLVKYGAKATFFAGYKKDYLHYTKYIQDNGSLVGMHTYTHQYGVCYKTMYSYYQGLDTLGKAIKSYIGTTPNIIRFPGGTNNCVSNALTMKRISVGAADMGYKVFDWTGSSGDAVAGYASKSYSIQQVKKTCTQDEEVILFHEKAFNIPALETILPYLTSKGYIFETLDKCPVQYTFKPRYTHTTPSTAVAIKNDSVSVYEDKTVLLSAGMTPSNSTDYIRWSSSDSSVAQVSIDGTVTGIKKGTAVITALTSSGKIDTCVVTVKIPARTVTLSERTYYLETKGNFVLSAELSPSDAEDTVKWTTSNRKIATVDSNGNVTALKCGSVIITATAGSGVKSSCTVYVINPTTSVQIKNAADIYLGKTRRLTAKLSRNAYDPITWTSDNPSIATVSSNGTVTGVSPGRVTITASSHSGKSDSVTIYVRTKANKIGLDTTVKKILIGESFTLNFNIIEPESCNDSIKWKASTGRYSDMNVSEDGRSAEITGINKGTYTVTVSTGSGKYVKCRVTVVMPTESLKINKQTASIYIGKKLYLNAYPATRGSNDYVETWSSSDTSVATVNSKGVVTAVSKGTATITATSFSGKTVSCQVLVRQLAKSISLSQTSLTASKEDVIVLNASITSPENCNDTVKWSTSSKSRAVILKSDENSAEIKVVGKGTVYITVKTGSGKSAKCRIVCK